MPPMGNSVQKMEVERTREGIKTYVYMVSLHTSMNRILGSVLLWITELLKNGRQLTWHKSDKSVKSAVPGIDRNQL